MMMIIVLILCAALLGACACLAIKANKMETRAAALNAQLEAEREHAKRLLDEKDNAFERLRDEKDKQLDLLESKHNEALEKISSMLGKTLNEAAEAVLNKRSEEMEQRSNKAMHNILFPLKSDIEKMKAAVESNTNKQRDSINSMDELINVFKHNSQAQGYWGEIVLSELLNSQGLTEGIHYEVQQKLKDEKGNDVKNVDTEASLKPDVILHLDEDRDVIVDSKVSLAAFWDYANAQDEMTRKDALKRHVRAINDHVTKLSRKDYSSYVKNGKASIDYVIMFVPHSGALWTAMNEDTGLWRKAMENRVYIADEQTLYAALKIIAMTWRQIKQASNRKELFELANTMIKRVEDFYQHYMKIGKALASAQDEFVAAGKKLEDKGQSIITTSRQIVELGVKENKVLPL